MNKALALVIVAVVVATAVTAAVSAAVGPAWQHQNKIDPSGQHLTQAAGPVYAGATPHVAYVIASTADLNVGNTSVCSYDAMKTGTCVDMAVNVASTTLNVARPLRANYIDGFLITTHDANTNAGMTYRWNSYFGVEWTMARGDIAQRYTEVTDYVYNTLIMVTSTKDGGFEIINGVMTSNHKRKILWQTPLAVPAGHVKANTAYARDFVWLYDTVPMVGFISLGRVFSMFANGTVLKHVDTPCGFTNTAFEMKGVRLHTGDFALIVWGNTAKAGPAGQDAFQICVLNMTGQLNAIWNATFNYTVTLADGDDSIESIRSAYDPGNGIQFVTDHLFVSGYDNGPKPAQSKLWCFNMITGQLSWALNRTNTDVYNMPVFIEGPSDEHVAVTVNGTMMGMNPVTEQAEWTCGAPVMEGCQGTPAVVRSTKYGTIKRLVCVSSKSPSRIIALDVANQTNPCFLAWESTTSMPVDVAMQNRPASVVYHYGEIEPFVAFVSTDGSVTTASVRSAAQPPPPTPAPPTPAPTLPPHVYPEPAYHEINTPLQDLADIDMRNTPIITPYSVKAMMMAGVATADVLAGFSKKDETLFEKVDTLGESDEIGIGSVATVFYYQSISLPTHHIPSYGIMKLPTGVYLRTPIVNYAQNGQFVTVTTMENGDYDLLVLRTVKNSIAGDYEHFGRYGAWSKIASDGHGNFFYTTGAIDGVEHLYAMTQYGSTSKTALKWNLNLSSSSKNHTLPLVNTGDLVFAATAAGQDEFVAFSYENNLTIVNTAKGQIASAHANPCGFKPSQYNTNTAQYFPQDVFWIRTAKENFVLTIIDTWKTAGSDSYGVCGVSLTSQAIHIGFMMYRVTWISSAYAIGDSNVFALEYFDSNGLGYLIGYDASLGHTAFNLTRDRSWGANVQSMPGTSQFVTNADKDKAVAFSLLDASNKGAIVAQCDFGCDYFEVVKDNKGASIVICSVTDFTKFVRAISFAGNKCTVEWEADMGAPVHAIEAGSASISGKLYVSIVTDNGYIYSACPGAGIVPTPAPTVTVPPNTNTKPKSVNVTQLSSQFATPLAFNALVSLKSLNYAYGAVSFVSVDAGVTMSTESSEVTRKTVLIAYQSEVLGTTTKTDPLFAEFAARTIPWDPVFLGENGARTAVAFATRYPSDGWLVILAFPTNKFEIARLGAYTLVATDGAGTVFYSTGAVTNKETVKAVALSADGKTTQNSWTYTLDNPKAVTDFTSHVGNPLYTVSMDDIPYVSFSFYTYVVTLHAGTGKIVTNLDKPCNWTSPPDLDNGGAPQMMELIQAPVPAGKGTPIEFKTVALINTEESVSANTYGLCALDASGTHEAWKTVLTDIGKINAITTLTPIGQPFFIVDAISHSGNEGVLFGVDSTSGGKWQITRKYAAGHKPVGVPPDSKLFVANMDDIAGNNAMYLSIAQSDSGAVKGACNFACYQTPVVATTPSGHTIYVCSDSIYTQILRAVIFDAANGYTCVVYWEKIFDEFVTGVSPAANGDVAALVATMVAPFASVAAAGEPPLTPAPPPGPNPNPNPPPPPGTPAKSGLSGGVVAAIVILVLLAVCVAAGGAYLIRRRNVKRSAIVEGQSQLQYQAGSGYGAIS